MTRKDQPILWGEGQESHFNTIMKLLTSAEVMAYFDSNKETELVTDPSPSGQLVVFSLSHCKPLTEDYIHVVGLELLLYNDH